MPVDLRKTTTATQERPGATRHYEIETLEKTTQQLLGNHWEITSSRYGLATFRHTDGTTVATEPGYDVTGDVTGRLAVRVTSDTDEDLESGYVKVFDPEEAEEGGFEPLGEVAACLAREIRAQHKAATTGEPTGPTGPTEGQAALDFDRIPEGR